MSESTTQPATELASQYSVQVTDDLERNLKEQERISAEITSLQQQLAALQHDHALLVNMQQALGITPPPSPPVTAAEPAAAGSATVPAPRDGDTAEPAAGKRTRGRRTAAAPKRAAAPKPGAKPSGKPGVKPAAKSAARSKPAAKSAKSAPKQTPKPSAKAAGKAAAKKPSPQAASAQQAAAQPTLVELVRTHLAEQSEPRSAAEITTALGQAHSGRTIKTTVVRTTLEGLVARNQAQRTKQGTSVYYTATDAPEAAKQQDTEEKATSAQSGD
ncbi:MULTISPECIES: hypothetical protein [unclassified Streptomyces]|uniref:hypothetical protein n=1 Tax=unclassified Streptomyces TaxID=2593676 RepID=UPI00234B4C90|nr:hypothetical protein [Streptomyces sp. M92]WCN04800.1 hypothetical protein M6G08_23255 [Streptomyces sp. M92]